MWPRPAAVEPTDHGQPILQRMAEHATDLGVVVGALRTGIDAVVVGNDVDGAAFDPRRSHHQAVGRTLHLGDGGSHQAAVLDERACVGEGGNTLASGPSSSPLLASDGFRPRSILEGQPRLLHLYQGDARHGPPVFLGHHSALMFAARITSR